MQQTWILVTLLCGTLGFACDEDTFDPQDAGADSQTSGDGVDVQVPLEHRPATTSCDDFRAPGGALKFPQPSQCLPDEGCSEDADCVAGQNGRCARDGTEASYCTYDECADDEGCPAESVCACDGEGSWASDNSACLQAGDCVTDADCGSQYCSPTRDFCGPDFTIGYFCHTERDTCVDDQDCMDEEYCAYNQNQGLWMCVVEQECVCE